MKLVRISKIERGEGATFGVLINRDGIPICYTLENLWRDNQRNVSSIPVGEYTCKRRRDRRTSGGTHLAETFEVTGVMERSGILFHPGNTSRDTEGCILPGLTCGTIRDTPSVLNSRAAYNKFLSELEGEEEFELEILLGY